MICGAYVSTAPDAKPTFHKTISQNTQAQNRLTSGLTTPEEIMTFLERRVLYHRATNPDLIFADKKNRNVDKIERYGCF
jgi:hypothetical protein